MRIVISNIMQVISGIFHFRLGPKTSFRQHPGHFSFLWAGMAVAVMLVLLQAAEPPKPESLPDRALPHQTLALDIIREKGELLLCSNHCLSGLSQKCGLS